MCKHLDTGVVSCSGKTRVPSYFFVFLLSKGSNCITVSRAAFLDETWWKQRMNSIRFFFKQPRKSFRYLVLENKPRIGLDIPSGSNYAFDVHSSTSFHLCGFEKQPHSHVLFECDSNIRKDYTLPCLYSTFFILFADCSNLVMQGEIMTRLQVAMQYNVKENKTLLAQAN